MIKTVNCGGVARNESIKSHYSLAGEYGDIKVLEKPRVPEKPKSPASKKKS